jgi:hypothetical protein
MHILNTLFSKVFVITVNPPNERISYISEYFSKLNLNYDLRVAPHYNYFNKLYDGLFEINENEQSLQAAYCNIFYEAYYKNLESIVILEDDNQFIDDFKNSFMQFYENVPEDWNFLHLGEYQLGYVKTKENYITTSVNEYVNKVVVKHSSNCTIFRKTDTYKLIADKIIQVKYPVDLVFTDFPYRNILNCYSPTKELTKQLSTRISEVPTNCFKSLLR